MIINLWGQEKLVVLGMSGHLFYILRRACHLKATCTAHIRLMNSTQS